MKKTFILLLPILFILCFNHKTIAQGGLRASGTYPDKPVRDELKKGNWTYGLNGLGNYFNGFNGKGGSWSLTPQAGFFVANRLVAGMQLSIGKEFSKPKSGNAPSPTTDYKFYSLAPELFARYYITSYRIKPFVQISSGHNFQWGNQINKSSERVSLSASNYTVLGALGLNFLLNKSIAVEALYNHRFATNSEFADPNKHLKVRLGISLFIR